MGILVAIGVSLAVAGEIGRYTLRHARSAPASGDYFAFTTAYPPVYDVRGFFTLSRLEVFRVFDGEAKAFSFPGPGGRYTLRWSTARGEIAIERGPDPVIVIPVAPLITRVRDYLAAHPGASPQSLPQGVLTLDAGGAGLKARIYVEDGSARRCGAGWCWYHLKADVLLGAAGEGWVAAGAAPNRSEIRSNR
jgi:hypothetical protein